MAARNDLPQIVREALDVTIVHHTWPIADTDVCPTCGGVPGTIERVRGKSELTIENGRGDWESGSTDMDWNDSQTLLDYQGNIVLECMECGVEWAHPKLVLESGLGNTL